VRHSPFESARRASKCDTRGLHMPCHFCESRHRRQEDRKAHKDIANARLYFGRPESQARFRGKRTGRFEIRHRAVPDKETGPAAAATTTTTTTTTATTTTTTMTTTIRRGAGGVWPASKTRDARGFIARKSWPRANNRPLRKPAATGRREKTVLQSTNGVRLDWIVGITFACARHRNLDG